MTVSAWTLTVARSILLVRKEKNKHTALQSKGEKTVNWLYLLQRTSVLLAFSTFPKGCNNFCGLFF